MICPKCKNSFPFEANFCPNCGKKTAPSPRKRRAKSRGNGTGCAYYDQIHHYWVAQVVDDYRIPKDEQKQLIPVKKTKGGFKTRQAALAYCPTLKAQETVENVTLQALYDRWEPWYSPRVDPDTFGCYRAAFAYFKPLHSSNIRSISAGNLQKCLDDCPRGHRTHQNMKVTAGLLWSYAMDHDLVAKDVTRNLYIGRGASVQREPLSDLEVEKIRKQIGKDRYAAYVYALCYLGYRPGEMLEIKKEQVHEQDGSLYIIEGKKTDAGRDRIVPVHKKIEPIIRQQLETEGTDFLFPMHVFSRKGTFLGFKQMSDNYFNKYAFRPLADRLGIPKNKVPYSARHTFSDKLKKADGNDKDKAALIGHTDYRFTQKKYQSSNIDDLKEIMDSII